MTRADTAGGGGRRPWWRGGVPLTFAAVMVAATLAVVFENRLVPQPKGDQTSQTTVPGGGTFCAPTPAPVPSVATDKPAPPAGAPR